MAHFRGVLRGNRGEVTRLGGKVMGLATESQSWQGKAVTYLWHDESTGKDMLEVILTQHSNGAGCAPARVVFRGPVDGSGLETNDGNPNMYGIAEWREVTQ